MYQYILSIIFFRLDCSTPPSVENGNVTYTSTLFGDALNVTCDIGYSTNDTYMWCTDRGMWTQRPVCKPVGMYY